MANKQGNSQFQHTVLVGERQQINARRNNIKEHPSNPLDDNLTASHEIPDLTGLAISGGGIRSASFSLGVIQHFIANDTFKKFDYLSTVSGGGYTGSCISALMKQEPDKEENQTPQSETQNEKTQSAERLLTQREHSQEPPALNHIRNNSNYLVPKGLLNSIRLPVLFLEGAIRSILLIIPLVILLVFMTELFFELSNTLNTNLQFFIPLIASTPLLFSLALRPILRDRSTWHKRDNADQRFSSYVLWCIASLVAMPIISTLRQLTEKDASTLINEITNIISSNILLFEAIVVASMLVILLGIIFSKAKTLLFIAGIMGPMILLSIYFLCCIEAINSPLARINYKVSDILHARDSNNNQCAEQSLPFQIIKLLKTKHLKGENYCLISYTNNTVTLKRTQDDHRSFFSMLSKKSPEKLTLKINEVKNDTDGKFTIEIQQLRLLKGNAEWWLYAGGLLIWFYNLLFININRFSLHPFYRDRLSKTFLLKAKDHAIKSADAIKLSELSTSNSTAPYHIINTALNLHGSDNAQLRSRKSVPFILSPNYCGSDFTGYCETKKMEQQDPNFNLGTAMAISAAAASPNMGTMSIKPLTFLMTLLNIRLNYWLPNPNNINTQGSTRTMMPPRLGLKYLLKEAFAKVDEKSPYVNCSDGGHIENLAVYELLKRRCKTIICIDGEADPNFNFYGLITLQRYAEIDLGAHIDIDLNNIRPNSEGVSEKSCTVGTITYTDNGKKDFEGKFIYIKLSLSKIVPEYINFYKNNNSDFPHESTGDQFFDETQFEVYRALGNHIAENNAELLNYHLT